MEITLKTEEDSIQFGKKLGEKLKAGDIVALDGDLAAGKTYLTKGIALGLDIDEEITSPTFTLVSEYWGKYHLYHMDVYRLENSDDFIDMGGEDMLYDNGVCVIEWSNRIKDILPAKTIFIQIKVNEDASRTLKITNNI